MVIKETFSPIINGSSIEKIKNSDIYKRWKNKVLSNFDVKSITIHNVFMFGSRVGFVIVEADAYLKSTNKKVPGIAFLRGDCVSIMPVIKCNGETYTVLVTEARVPVGEANKTALPAGMTDGCSFISTALKELEEEIGPDFNVNENDMVFMGNYSVSSGGCDEHMAFYYFEKEVSKEVLEEINGRNSGEKGTCEHIITSVIKLDDIDKVDGIDMRSMFSYFLWKNRKTK